MKKKKLYGWYSHKDRETKKFKWRLGEIKLPHKIVLSKRIFYLLTLIIIILLIYSIYATKQWFFYQKVSRHWEAWKNWWYEYVLELERKLYL